MAQIRFKRMFINDVQGKNHLIEAAKKSLKAATMPQMRTNYIYYTDIK